MGNILTAELHSLSVPEGVRANIQKALDSDAAAAGIEGAYTVTIGDGEILIEFASPEAALLARSILSMWVKNDGESD